MDGIFLYNLKTRSAPCIDEMFFRYALAEEASTLVGLVDPKAVGSPWGYEDHPMRFSGFHSIESLLLIPSRMAFYRYVVGCCYVQVDDEPNRL
jgi:hypothetical protein